MPSTADLLADLAVRLDQRGLPVEHYAGWRRRGRGPLRVRGWVWHDTSDAAPLSRERMLELLAEGHGRLNNAICNIAIPRQRPAIVIVAARTAWHVGRGSWQGLRGNSSVGGTEIQRAVGQTITADQRDLAAELGAAIDDVFGRPTHYQCLHSEWTTRKVDPRGWQGPRWRNEIRTLDSHQPAGDEPPDEEDDVKLEIWTGTDPEGDSGVWAVKRDGPTEDGYMGHYMMLDPKRADQYKQLGGRRNDIIVSDGDAQPTWFTAGGLKRIPAGYQQ